MDAFEIFQFSGGYGVCFETEEGQEIRNFLTFEEAASIAFQHLRSEWNNQGGSC